MDREQVKAETDKILANLKSEAQTASQFSADQWKAVGLIVAIVALIAALAYFLI